MWVIEPTIEVSNRTLPRIDRGPGRGRVQREVRLLMRPYEIVAVFDPTLEESAVQAVINRSTELLERRGATVNRVDKWGRRRLAYEVAHRSEGYYVLFEVTSEPPPVDELDRALRLADEVIRHKIVRVPQHAGGRVLPSRAADELAAMVPQQQRAERHSEERGTRHA